ncbi:MAG: RNA polymerase subunit sigma [Pseudonocardiales bacterium]|nr:RNA polymerase subunit sigma [Pseudonocardiales bacterium]
MTLTAAVTHDRVGDDELQVAVLIAAAAAGDRVARFRLMAVVQPAVLRYCRARLGTGDAAAEVARRVCRTVLATLADLPDSAAKVRAFVHGIAADLVDAVPVPAGLPGMAGMLTVLSPAQREVLVLRVAVGLSAEDTASTIGSTPGAVRHIQHHALERLRSAG